MTKRVEYRFIDNICRGVWVNGEKHSDELIGKELTDGLANNLSVAGFQLLEKDNTTD
jgi:hypothetical protein